MNTLLCDARLEAKRRGFCKIIRSPELSLEAVQELLQEEGEAIKASRKSQVRRVDNFLIKESTGGLFTNTFKHSLRKKRYRKAWLAAHHLQNQGLLVARPIAFVEYGACGLIRGNVMISEFLANLRNVEKFLVAIIQRGAGHDTLTQFFSDLAGEINKICDSGAFHGDLSGKNILTADGKQFYFIDLDAVDLEVEYTPERRLKNHVQLYDSFCDQISDTLLVPFIEAMLPASLDLRVWMPSIREQQAKRRRRIEAIWEKEGRGSDKR